jgi:hypothetical protein
MGGGPRSADAPLPSTATSADQSTTAVESEPHAAELDHPIDTATAPDAATTSIEPTAVGPAAPSSHAVMAIETAQAQITPAYPTTPYPEAVLPETADNSLPQVRTSEPAVARLRGNVLETQPR